MFDPYIVYRKQDQIDNDDNQIKPNHGISISLTGLTYFHSETSTCLTSRNGHTVEPAESATFIRAPPA